MDQSGTLSSLSSSSNSHSTSIPVHQLPTDNIVLDDPDADGEIDAEALRIAQDVANQEHHHQQVAIDESSQDQPQSSQLNQSQSQSQDEIQSVPGPQFPEVGSQFPSRDEFIDMAYSTAGALGFKLWVGEGRAVKDVVGSNQGRLELLCSKFRTRNEKGQKTRVGGCRFCIKAREVTLPPLSHPSSPTSSNPHSSQSQTDTSHPPPPPPNPWEIVSLQLTHNHPLGTPQAIAEVKAQQQKKRWSGRWTNAKGSKARESGGGGEGSGGKRKQSVGGKRKREENENPFLQSSTPGASQSSYQPVQTAYSSPSDFPPPPGNLDPHFPSSSSAYHNHHHHQLTSPSPFGHGGHHNNGNNIPVDDDDGDGDGNNSGPTGSAGFTVQDLFGDGSNNSSPSRIPQIQTINGNENETRETSLDELDTEAGLGGVGSRDQHVDPSLDGNTGNNGSNRAGKRQRLRLASSSSSHHHLQHPTSLSQSTTTTTTTPFPNPLNPSPSTSPISLPTFFRTISPELEKYAEGFIKLGCRDVETLMKMPESELRIFVMEDLKRVDGEIGEKPFHARLLIGNVVQCQALARHQAQASAIPTTSALAGVGGSSTVGGGGGTGGSGSRSMSASGGQQGEFSF